MSELEQVLRAIKREMSDVDLPNPKPFVNTTPELLEHLLADLRNRHELKVGDVVEWKEHLRNRKFPDYGKPAIIVKTYAEPIVDKGEIGSQYFMENVDVAIGLITPDGDFTVFHASSERFKPYAG